MTTKWVYLLRLGLLAVLLTSGTPALQGQQESINYPDTIGHNIGSSEAELEILVFVDFGCAECARFNLQTYPSVEAEFIRTGKVRWKILPFSMGRFRNSAFAAEAAECAAEQGAFQKMHDELLARPRDWSVPLRPTEGLLKIATESGLDTLAYKECVSSQRKRPLVRDNKALAFSLGIFGTPTFIIGRKTRVIGSLPEEDFLRIVRRELVQLTDK